MFKKLILGSVALSMAATMAMAADGVRFNVANGDKEEAYNKMVNESIESIGYILSDPHERINDGYAKKYDTKPNLDNLGFFSIAEDGALRELLIKAPELGGFSPFNLHIYKRMGEDKTYVGHVVPSTMLDIVGVTDKKVRSDFEALFPKLDKMVQDQIGGEVEITKFDSLTKNPMMKFELTFDRPDDIIDFIEGFQEEFEEVFEENKYIIAGYKNFAEVYTDREEDFSKYDAYFVYSLCHFKFSEGIFNQGRPDAGVFAPCSMYMYIEKDSNVMHIGMPKLENWISVMNIKDSKKVKAIHALDKEIIGLMNGLGAKSKWEK